jgi:hypothetical protein
MLRILPILLALTPTALGQTPKGTVAPEPAARPGRAELTAPAAPAPVPALRYELLPPGRDRVPGNAAVGYLKAAALQPPWPRDPDAARKQSEKTEKWDLTPYDQLPAAEVDEFLKAYRDMLRTVDEAARTDRCDWQQRLAGPEAISGALTVVQGHRELARWLSLRARLELAQDRPADAVRTLQTGFRLGKDVGEGGTMIQMLVGHAITTIMIGRAEDVIRHPDGPNLYWALTTLPQPFIDPRPSLDGEARFTANFLPWLAEMQAGPVSEEQAQKAFRDTLRMMGGVARDVPKEENLTDLIGNIGLAAGLAAQGKQAKADLLARGWKEKDVAAMPNAQAVILLTAAVHQEVWDDQVKLFHLPPAAAAAEMAKVRKRADDLRKAHPGNPLIAVFALLYPAVEKVYAAHVRVDRRLAQLRAVEAVRLHAAQSGSVPKALAEATTVPVPDDPATGKPFVYRAEGDTFTLSAPPPKGEAPNPSNAFEYVVTVRKK